MVPGPREGGERRGRSSSGRGPQYQRECNEGGEAVTERLFNFL